MIILPILDRATKFPTSLHNRKHFHITPLMLNIPISFLPFVPEGYAGFLFSLSNQFIFPSSAVSRPGHNRQSLSMPSTAQNDFMNFAGCKIYHRSGHCIYNIVVIYCLGTYSLVTMWYLSVMIYMWFPIITRSFSEGFPILPHLANEQLILIKMWQTVFRWRQMQYTFKQDLEFIILNSSTVFWHILSSFPHCCHLQL